MLTFRTMDEAAAGIEEIKRNYPAHCKAAREIAETYFDSDKVLTKILEQAGGGRMISVLYLSDWKKAVVIRKTRLSETR